MSTDIIQAMDDPRLFEPWFRGPSWDGWRAVLKAAFALPMTTAEVEFFRTVAERDPPQKRVRELWIVAGRRAGKDSIASLVAAWSASMFDQQHRLRPGERSVVACMAGDRDQARIILEYTRGYFAESPLLRQMIQEDERASDFKLTNQVDVAVMTNSFRAPRGRPVLLGILDELGIWRDETSQNPDEEVYRALLPGLASVDGMLIGISTPYRKSGLLYSKFKKHFGQNGDDVLVIRAPTRLLNPTIDQSIIDRALADDRAAAMAEWMAEFRDDITGWLALEVIQDAVEIGVTVRPPRREFTYTGFVDPSGGVKDGFTAAVSHVEDDTAVLDALIEIPAPFDPASATKVVAQFLASYGLREAISDRYGAQWVVSEFDRCGVYLKHSARDRSSIYLDTLPLFTSGRARLLDSPRLASQFAGLERKTSSMGKDKVDHGPGGHDDLCNAAAGALVNATNESQNRLVSVPFWQGFDNPNAEVDDADQNFLEAEQAYREGEFKWRDIAWLMGERQRRATRAAR